MQGKKNVRTLRQTRTYGVHNTNAQYIGFAEIGQFLAADAREIVDVGMANAGGILLAFAALFVLTVAFMVM